MEKLCYQFTNCSDTVIAQVLILTDDGCDTDYDSYDFKRFISMVMIQMAMILIDCDIDCNAMIFSKYDDWDSDRDIYCDSYDFDTLGWFV